MSLINEALKRAQKAQVGQCSSPQDQPLQVVVQPRSSSSRGPLLLGVAGIASLSFALWLNPLWRQHPGENRQQAAAQRFGTVSHAAGVSAPMPTLAHRDTYVAPPEPASPASALNGPQPVEVAAPQAAASKAAPTAVGNAAFTIYVVRAGDTLTRIARRHATTVRALRATNDLKIDRIIVGQKLRVPAA
jgi:LysM repeat protein